MCMMYIGFMTKDRSSSRYARNCLVALLASILVVSVPACLAQVADPARIVPGAPGGRTAPVFPPGVAPEFDGPPPTSFGGPPGFGAPGFGPPMGGVQEERKLVGQFDKNGDKRLDAQERKAAREFLAREQAEGRWRRMPGRGRGPGFGDADAGSAKPGPRVTPAEARTHPGVPLYDEGTLRTIFLEFENADWEKELSDFFHTDVEVPVKMTVDGRTYLDVGVHFRGASSYFMVGEGRKRSLNLSVDFVHEDQRIGGYRTLNLLNSHGDPTFLRTVLYHHIARAYVPAPKACLVRVVINGESWGIYVSQQQINKDFLKEWFQTTQGARWKVPGSPNGRGGLEYLGQDAAAYQRLYELKSKEDSASWGALIRLCKVLNETPTNQLEQALAPLLDIDGALRFLALENALINNDGYWVRASDYDLYLDTKGQFHVLPNDANETFTAAGGPGFGGGPRGFGPRQDRGRGGGGAPGGAGFGGGARGGGLELDPLIGLNDSGKPLRSKLLAVPALRERYLGYVRDIAEKWLDWNRLGPLAERCHALITDEVKADTRRLSSLEAFEGGLTQAESPGGGFGPGARISLKTFAETRRAFLLNHAAIRPTGSKR